MDPHEHHEQPRQASRGKWVLIGFLAVAAYFLWSEHRAHLMGALPYLLLLACPLMHIFHHGGHGHHHGKHEQAGERDAGTTRNRTGEGS